MIDVNQFRQPDIALHELTRVDAVYTLYYDETNNIRRLHTRADGFNVGEPKCFVIAGIAHHGPPYDLNIDDLRERCRIQKTTTDIKLEHIAKGDFLKVLGARRLEQFLRWALEKEFFLHFSVLDPLYWSTVDIIDSILSAHGEPQLYPAHWQLKNALYAIMRDQEPDLVALFRRYSYPAVGRERRSDFIFELRQLLTMRGHLLGQFDYMLLKGVLQIAEELDTLPYLEEEPPNVLIDGFGLFFIGRICLFKNSYHILDVEKVIEQYIGEQTFMDGDRQLKTFRFAVSDDEPGVQISDVIAGLLGKLFSMIQRNDQHQLAAIRGSFSTQQQTNLGLLKRLLGRSVEENKAFAHYILSLEDQQRASLLLD